MLIHAGKCTENNTIETNLFVVSFPSFFSHLIGNLCGHTQEHYVMPIFTNMVNVEKKTTEFALHLNPACDKPALQR